MLTEVSVRNAKAADKARKLSDGHGLYLLVTPGGAKYWRYKYRFAGKEKTLALGVYPEISLKEARASHAEARDQLRKGNDPGAVKQSAKASQTRTFAVVYAEWFAGITKSGIRNRTVKKFEWLYRCHLGPAFGALPVATITDAMIVKELKKRVADGALETAHRMRAQVNRVMRYAKAHGDITSNPATDLVDVLPPLKHEHHAAITDPAEIGGLLRAIDGYQGQPTTLAALKLAPLLFVRPVELRMAQWKEFDLGRAEWRIPDDRMKEGEYHVVPLSRQALKILRDLEPYTGHGTYVFPHITDPKRPMSENTVNGALRRLGYSGDEQTGHGFRTLASTMLNELEYNADHIEKQLAHSPKDKVRAAYNRAQRLPARRKMMQEWADYLDSLKNGARCDN